ncbi:hypothetical protein KEM55_008244, partial [Ascosphaera atra]
RHGEHAFLAAGQLADDHGHALEAVDVEQGEEDDVRANACGLEDGVHPVLEGVGGHGEAAQGGRVVVVVVGGEVFDGVEFVDGFEPEEAG